MSKKLAQVKLQKVQKLSIVTKGGRAVEVEVEGRYSKKDICNKADCSDYTIKSKKIGYKVLNIDVEKAIAEGIASEETIWNEEES